MPTGTQGSSSSSKVYMTQILSTGSLAIGKSMQRDHCKHFMALRMECKVQDLYATFDNPQHI